MRERERAGECDFVLYQVSINVIGRNDFYASSNKVKSAEMIIYFFVLPTRMFYFEYY